MSQSIQENIKTLIRVRKELELALDILEEGNYITTLEKVQASRCRFELTRALEQTKESIQTLRKA